jgi:hypothetical protein
MPVPFPDHVDPETGALAERDYYTVAELAAMLHTSERTVYARLKSGTWPYVRVVRTPYFSPDHVAEIFGLFSHEAGTPGGLWADQGRTNGGRKRNG